MNLSLTAKFFGKVRKLMLYFHGNTDKNSKFSSSNGLLLTTMLKNTWYVE
jgi:hypothetical protein